MRDHLGRHFMTNDRDTDIFLPTMDVYRFYSADRRTIALALAVILMALTIPTTILRLHVRKNIVKAVGSDDYWIAASQCIFIIFIGLDINALINGIGFRQSQMTLVANE